MTQFLSQAKTQVSLSFGASLAVITITLLTILDDKLPVVHTWLTHTFSHHWVGKGVLAVAVFVLASVMTNLLPLKPNTQTVSASFRLLHILAIMCFFLLVAFFGMELMV